MHRRFPKFGMSKNRFNNGVLFEQLNLGKLAYHIEKGNLDTSKQIDMKALLEAGVVSKISHGVKLLAKGVEKFQQLNTPVNLQISDASKVAIEAVKAAGGNLSVEYRTPLILRNHLKPHKFDEHKELKTPMPPNKQIKKLERLRTKGLEVNYPDAPWFTDNREAI
jgi:large subunit ribosomal protein L15